MLRLSVVFLMLLACESTFADINQSQLVTLAGPAWPLLKSDLTKLLDLHPSAESTSAMPKELSPVIDQLKQWTYSIGGGANSTHSKMVNWIVERMEKHPAEVMRIASATGTVSHILAALVNPSSKSKNIRDLVEQEILLQEPQNQSFWWDMFTPIGDGNIQNEESSRVVSPYLAYVLSYVVGWICMIQFLGGALFIITSDADHAILLPKIMQCVWFFGLLLVMSQYIYAATAWMLASSKGSSFCSTVRTDLNFLYAHLFFMLFGLLDPTVPLSFVPTILEQKKAEGKTIEPSELQHPQAWDDVRVAYKIGSIMKVFQLILTKQFSRIALIIFLVHFAYMITTCAVKWFR